MAKKAKSSKKYNRRRLAQIGLWISASALLAGSALLVIKLLASMGLFTSPNPKTIAWALWICLALIIIGPAIYTLVDPNRVREFLTGRQARYGSNAVIMLLAFIGILIVINLIIYQNPIQWDLTADKKHTLAPETLNTLNALPDPVQALAFYTTRISKTDAQNLLADLKANSRGKLDYQFIDPELDPIKAQQYEITRDGTIVLVMGDRKEVVSYASEQEVTNALVRLMNPGQRTLYFLTGHGEHDIQNSSQTSYTRVRTVLESKGYTVRTLNLLAQNQIPEDAKAIIIAGPTQPISAQEMTLLGTYTSNGGSLIVLEEPSVLTKAGDSSDPLTDYLSKTWGVILNNDFIIDPIQNPVSFTVADSQNYGQHPITDKLQGRTIFFPTARSLSIKTVDQVQSTILASTIDRAWGETDFEALRNSQFAFDRSKDLQGPLAIAIAAENSSGNSRIVVIGDSDFANDTFFDQYANGDMVINSIDWATEQENMINLTAKQPISRQMIPPSRPAMITIALAFICILPGVIVGGGVSSWLMRRSRG